ncbi:MAG: cell division protein FtsZ [Chloroflexota bacterium]
MTNYHSRNVRAVIKVIGVGGGGSNAIDRMVEDGLQDVEFVAVNTDLQVLRNSKADQRICIGERLTRGMGAGGEPGVGTKAAEETSDELYEIIKGADMVFITAGMGGGTGTGAAPIVAQIAQDLGVLTVAVVTKPFKFEGPKRIRQAEQGIEQLRKYVDALVVVPNDRLIEAYARRGVSMLQGFQIADSVLRQGIQGVADLITKPGIVNVDFADVRTVLENSGEALMSIGVGSGENRIQQAIDAAMSSPLLDMEIRGAKRVLLNIASGEDLRMQEVADAAGMIESTVDEDAQIIWGTTVDPNFPPDQVKITLLATGITVMRPKVLHPMRPGFGNNDNGNEIRGLNSGIGNDRSARPLPTPPNTPQPPLSGRPVTGSQSTVPDAPPANSGNRSGGGSILGLRSPLDGRRRTDSSTDRIPNDDVDLSVPPHMRKNPPR